MTISLVDFTLGLSVGMIEPMTVRISTEIAEQIANIEDKPSYLLGKICGNVITSMYFSGIAVGSGLGAVVALPTWRGIIILGEAAVISGAVVISANTWFIVNSLMFAEILGSGNGGGPSGETSNIVENGQRKIPYSMSVYKEVLIKSIQEHASEIGLRIINLNNK